MDNWITQKLRGTCIRRLIGWAVPVALMIWIAAGNSDYVRGFVRGPRVVTASALASIRDPDGSATYYVRATGTRSINTGFQEISVETENGTETSRSVSAAYYALELGDRYLIVKSSGGPSRTVEGELGPLPADFEAEFFKSGKDQPDRSRFYPYYLEVSSFREPGYVYIGFAVVLIGLLYWKARPVWQHLQDLNAHPLVARVMRWGDPHLISSAVEDAWRSPKALRSSEWRMTEQYLVRSSSFHFDVLRLPDLLWAYKHVTKHSVNFIPTGKTYAAIMHCYGGIATLKGSEKAVDGFLRFASEHVPWAVFGHSAQIAGAWATDNAGFCRAVEDRKRKQSQS